MACRTEERFENELTKCSLDMVIQNSPCSLLKVLNLSHCSDDS